MAIDAKVWAATAEISRSQCEDREFDPPPPDQNQALTERPLELNQEEGSRGGKNPLR